MRRGTRRAPLPRRRMRRPPCNWAAVAHGVKRPRDARIVDLAGPWLLCDRARQRPELRRSTVGTCDTIRSIPLADLHMIEVEVQTQLRPIDRRDQRQGIFDAREGNARVVDRQIQVLEHEGDAVVGAEVGDPVQRVARFEPHRAGDDLTGRDGKTTLAEAGSVEIEAGDVGRLPTSIDCRAVDSSSSRLRRRQGARGCIRSSKKRQLRTSRAWRGRGPANSRYRPGIRVPSGASDASPSVCPATASRRRRTDEGLDHVRPSMKVQSLREDSPPPNDGAPERSCTRVQQALLT